ncbi:MAG: hypothetical protein ABIQ59_02345 [Nocardioidaceae bacterium]
MTDASLEHRGLLFTGAYLVRLVTRQVLNRMRTVKRRREAYVGPWWGDLGGALDSIVSVEVRDGLVREIFFVRNPDTLGHLDEAVGLTRT